MGLPAFLAALALALSLPSNGQTFTVSPAAPGPMDTITIRKAFDNEDITKTVVSMAGNRITVTLRSLGASFPEPPPGTLEQPIGRLPAGSYQVEVVQGDFTPARSLGTTTFTVAARAANQPVDDYSDIWWNPDESGWGLGVAQHADGLIFATFFVYAADGTPTWYVVPGGRWIGPNLFEGDVYRTTGPDITNFSAGRVGSAKVGAATLFFGIGGLSADLIVDGRRIRRLLQRQPF